jgi:L-ascorbate metabolism protein UlaG (beta-lactamase superfamily)
MKIKFLGHATFLLTAADGTAVITDPYEPHGFGGAIGHGPIQDRADIVTVSHDHADHNHARGVPGNPQVIQSVGEHAAKGVSITGVPTHHDSSGGSQRGHNIVFVIAVDGVRVCHLGDLGHPLTQDQAKALGEVDVLLVPVGGTFTVDATGASAVVQALDPKIVIPMHFKTPKVKLPLAPVDTFLAGQSNVRRAGASEVEIARDTLPAHREIIVLEPAL